MRQRRVRNFVYLPGKLHTQVQLRQLYTPLGTVDYIEIYNSMAPSRSLSPVGLVPLSHDRLLGLRFTARTSRRRVSPSSLRGALTAKGERRALAARCLRRPRCCSRRRSWQSSLGRLGAELALESPARAPGAAPSLLRARQRHGFHPAHLVVAFRGRGRPWGGAAFSRGVASRLRRRGGTCHQRRKLVPVGALASASAARAVAPAAAVVLRGPRHRPFASAVWGAGEPLPGASPACAIFT